MKRFIGIMSFLAVITVFTAKAQGTTPVVDQRQDNQKDRIEGGVKSGELTRRETRKLAKDQRELKRMEKRAKADGEVTNKERARLQQKENQNSRAIRRQKHDAQDRPRANKWEIKESVSKVFVLLSVSEYPLLECTNLGILR